MPFGCKYCTFKDNHSVETVIKHMQTKHKEKTAGVSDEDLEELVTVIGMGIDIDSDPLPIVPKIIDTTDYSDVDDDNDDNYPDPDTF